MALSQLTSSDVGAPARDKINQAIAEADKVGGLGAALALLQIRLAPYIDLVGGAPDRPGDAKTLFTRVMTGSPKGRAAIDKGSVEDGGELGQVLRISGADTDPGLGYIDVAPRRAYYMRPGRAYLVQHHFKRTQNPSDPLQHAVELRFQNLSSTFGQVSNVRLGGVYQPTEQDGAYFVDTFIGKAGAPGTPSYVVPPSSTYGVPFFRIYGNGHQTDLGLVRLYDVSDALAGGADVASILARVKKLEDGQLAGVTYAASWADLASRVGKVAGAGARTPDSDTGTHVDPVTGATVSNAGNFLWSVAPQGWRWVSVTDARQAADFVGAAAAILTDPLADDDGFLVWDVSAQTIKKQPFLSLISQLEARVAPPPVYWFKGPKAASTSEATMIAPGAGAAIIGNVRFQNRSKTAYVAVSFKDVPASLTDGGSYLFGPGQGRDFDIVPQGRIGFVSDTEGSPITCEFTSTVNVDPNSLERASKHLARYGSAMSDAQRTAVANLYNALYDSGWLDLCSAAKGGALWIGRAPGNFDGLINWSGTNNFGRLTVASDSAPPETSFAGTLFNGTSVIDSLVKPPLATLPNCALFTWTDASVKGPSKISAGNTVLRLNADRTSNDDAMYTGAGSSIVSGVPGVGGLKGFVRQNENTFRYYRNDTFKVDVAKTLNEATGGSQTITIGGLNTGSGIQQIQTTAMELAAIVMNGRPSDAQVARLYTAFSAFRTALGA